MDERLRNFGFLLKDVSRRYVLRFEQRASAISLTLPQCKVLTRLENNEGVSQAKLAELTEVDPMTMVRILDRMETEGLLERRPDPADRRARTLFLTPKAKPLLQQIWRLSEQTRAETFTGVSRAERDLFMAVLERLHGNICAVVAGPGGSEPTATPAQSAKTAPTAKARVPRLRKSLAR